MEGAAAHDVQAGVPYDLDWTALGLIAAEEAGLSPGRAPAHRPAP